MKYEIAGLGFWSEQSMESGHYDTKLEWEKVKVSANNVEYTESFSPPLSDMPVNTFEIVVIIPMY